jgi:hypothetical protein
LQHRLPPKGLLIGGAELGYGLSFDRVIDDEALGYHSGKHADLIAINAEYEDTQNSMRKEGLEYRYIKELLMRKYALVFDSGAYKVYESLK